MLQVQVFSLGLGTPVAALQTLPTVLVAQSALVAQMQKFQPVPARSVASQVGPLERGLSLQWVSLRHSSQRLFCAGFLTHLYSAWSIHSWTQLPVAPQAVLLSQSLMPSQLYLPVGQGVQAPLAQYWLVPQASLVVGLQKAALQGWLASQSLIPSQLYLPGGQGVQVPALQ